MTNDCKHRVDKATLQSIFTSVEDIIPTLTTEQK